MSLLTGEPRTATVVARGEAVVLELDAALFRRLGEESPLALEQVGLAAMTRREQLERARTAARSADLADAPATFLARMKIPPPSVADLPAVAAFTESLFVPCWNPWR